MKQLILIVCLYIVSAVGVSAQQTVGLFLNDSEAYNGYTLFAPVSSPYTYLIDNCGKVVNQWTGTANPGLSVYLLENGNLLRTTRVGTPIFNGGGSGGKVELYGWDGELLWNYTYSSTTYHQHHDIEPLPNGNILILAWELKTMSDAVAMGRNPTSIPVDGLWTEHIIEIEPVGFNEANIVWEWHLWDHLVQDLDATKQNYMTVSEHPELLDINYYVSGGSPFSAADWIHANGIDYNAELDQIVISARKLNEIWIIDHSTSTAEAASHSGGLSGKGGDFLYRWGNPEVYRRGDLADRQLFGQHDPQWIPAGYPDEGKISVFNNGLGRPEGSYSSVEIIDPPLGNDGNYVLDTGQAYGPDVPSWTYTSGSDFNFFSNIMSGVQQLPNGNVLICESTKGHLFEVDVDGVLRWQYRNPESGGVPAIQGNTIGQASVFRATRYSPDYPAFNGLNLVGSSTIEIDPMPAPCDIFEAPPVVIEMPTAIDELMILSNPVGDFFRVQNPAKKAFQIQVFDLMGRLVLSEKQQDFLFLKNVKTWNPGLYVVHIKVEGSTEVIVQKVIKL